ncbi:MAG: RagB/SusD family nutrient uptake outer membrane protein [Tannerella sp.]|jgi:hypothetical protein|nr:RagB/SusD family nutrient uptake outer membrane protein [Tannerella sp.]
MTEHINFIRHIAVIAAILLSATSCRDLELEPKGIIGETELFGSEYGVKKYFSDIYHNLLIEDFNYAYDRLYLYSNWEYGSINLANMCGELFRPYAYVFENGFGYWPYDKIRDINVFIHNFPDYASNFVSADADAILGEAYFLRAFYYFNLVKRYGGVPIITEAQNTTAGLETLKVSRDKEDATWQFIHDDLQKAIDLMGETSESGQVNKYAAAALMSRAMLYAGRIAKYSGYLNFAMDQLAAQQGLAGIPASRAEYYFTESYKAGKMIDDSGRFSLYRKHENLADNFAMLFQDRESPEDIWIKWFDMASRYLFNQIHCYDAVMVPIDFSSYYGIQGAPHITMMKYFDFPDIVDADGKPKRFDDKADIKNGMEPRLRGTMYFTGDPLRGKVMDIHRGLYKHFEWTTADANYGAASAAPNVNDNRILSDTPDKMYAYEGENYMIAGKHGIILNRDFAYTTTGSVVRKYINESLPISEARDHNCTSPWKVFRLGEIYLNIAEAAYELGYNAEAFQYIAAIRERAGASPRPLEGSPQNLSAKFGFPLDSNLQFIRDERYRELAFEGHWWWDLRSYGIVDQVLRNYTPRYLSAYYILDERKWIYLEEDNAWHRTWNATKRAFYEPIPASEIAKNENLLPQNPLW